MCAGNVKGQWERIQILEFGKVPCMHCQVYFRFEADKSVFADIIRDHDLKKVDSPPGERSAVLRAIDAPSRIREKDFEGSGKYFIAYDSPKSAGGERKIRVAVVSSGTMYFVTNVFQLHNKSLKGKDKQD